MNTTRVALAFLSVLLTAFPSHSAEPQTTDAPGFTVFLIDDQTGEELAVKHGIHPLNTSDLDGVLNAVLSNGKPVRILHQAVDEDATDNAVATMEFRPYAGGHPPGAPSPALPIQQLTEKMKKWREDRAAWQQGMMRYRKETIGQVEGFVRQVATTQMEVAQRFDKMLRDRNGRDFNRSDIFGCITAANQALTGQNRKVLILNTDAVDLPSKRAPRKRALTPAELDPRVELIFVNTSRLPEQVPMFTGIKNAIRHADSMREAMEMVVSMLGSSDGKDVAKTGN